MKTIVALLLAASLWLGLGIPAPAFELGIITGREKGTYYEIGQNLRQLMQQHDIQLSVYPSNGSVDNIYAVYKRSGMPLGIVQADVLAFVSKIQTNSLLKSVARKIKMVFPLYESEVHILGRKEISRFEDLHGKRVAIGDPGSGTYMTSKLLFEVSRVAPAEMLELGSDKALARLKAGAIDAMIYNAGAPVKLFEEGVAQGDPVHLIPLTSPEVLRFYPGMEIPAETYSWQKTSVSTVGVRAVLIAFDFRTAQCEQIGRFARILMDDLDWLRQHGHPKWKQVDLDYPLKGWEQYECVRKATQGRTRTEPTEENPLWDTIKEILR